MRIAHIINPVKVNSNSDLYLAQPITFESMRLAKTFADGIVDVELYTTQYPEDHDMLPHGFIVLPDLARSILDIKEFEHRRKLPLLGDILQQLYTASTAEYFIYTNVDIALMPHFYTSVATLLNQYDGLVINRRTISRYTSIAELPLMYTDIGKMHPGYDCFVFRREMFSRMQFCNACIGVPYIGVLMYANILAVSKTVLEITDAHLTFHIGDDKFWASEKNMPYILHNQQEMDSGLMSLREYIGPLNETTALGRFLIERYKKWNISSLKSVLALDNPQKVLKPKSLLIGRIKRRMRQSFNVVEKWLEPILAD